MYCSLSWSKSQNMWIEILSMQKTRAMAPCLKGFVLFTLLFLSVFAESSDHGVQDSITEGSKFQFGNIQIGSHGHMGFSSSKDVSDDEVSLNDEKKKKGKNKESNLETQHNFMEARGTNFNADADANAVGVEKPQFETNFQGSWRITTQNVGVSAMQLQLMPNDKVVWFDTTFLGDSVLKLTPPGNCPINFEKGYPDCYVHALEYDAKTDKTRQLNVRI